ncbi:MAG: lactate racemase domain-containing protein [Planctomycetaceae bacterium]
MLQFPRMCDVRQRFDTTCLDDIVGTVHQQLASLQLQDRIRPGHTVAVTAGSRGIANIPVILKAAIDHLRTLGAEPFIVPAMGSHGGGTVTGQLEVLHGLGITSQSVGAEIRATMETVVVAQTANGIPVHFDRYAHDADHVLVVNRIKPHTRFIGPIESGLHKMMLIGLGKHAGAEVYHKGILAYSFSQMIEWVAERVLQTCGIVGGLAILENAQDQTAMIEAVAPEHFAVREPELLKQAVRWLPTLPFAEADLLIIDRIGKNISGAGMDANVVGRKYNDHSGTSNDTANCLRIFIRGLTQESHGNGTGIGMSEFTTQRCVDQIDPVKTRTNCITAIHPEAAMIPITFDTDAEAVAAALQTIGMVAPQNARIIQIQDTLHLTTTRVSEAFFPLVEASDRLEMIGSPYDFPVDADGWMTDVSASEGVPV